MKIPPRLEHESWKQYAAFLSYCALLPQRKKFRFLEEQTEYSYRQLYRLKNKFSWETRARQFDTTIGSAIDPSEITKLITTMIQFMLSRFIIDHKNQKFTYKELIQLLQWLCSILIATKLHDSVSAKELATYVEQTAKGIVKNLKI